MSNSIAMMIGKDPSSFTGLSVREITDDVEPDVRVEDGELPPVPTLKSPMKWAYLSIIGFLAVFILWSVLAPMNSAAIAPGVLRAEGGGRKTIQHLEGGIIEAITVREGQSVSKGQVVARLDRTQTSAIDTALQGQYDTLMAQDARLTAERERRATIYFPAELTARASDPKVAEIMNGQKSVFLSRKNSQFAQLSILEQRVGQSYAEIDSYTAQIAALADQESLLNQEITNVAALVNEGLERQSRLLTLQRQSSSLEGQRGQLVANIARVRQSVSETEAQMVYLRDSLLTEVTAQQRDIKTQMLEIVERLKASNDVDKRREIVSPVDGRIVNLKFVTSGGVVRPGEPIMDVVPRNEKIIVLAKLKANDVDSVREGQEASVRLTPYKARIMPLLKGRVISVGADAIPDDSTQQLYYQTQIELNEKEIDQLKDVQLLSGMPAEVFINLGERSLFQYFVQPLVDSFRRAFREA
jgi:HlyD family secretion protein